MNYRSDQLKLEIEGTVTALFKKHQPAYLVYHNLNHTIQVVAHALEISAHYDLSINDSFILFAAAWFHDTGHLFTTPENHEEESVKIAEQFFQQQPTVPTRIVTAIADCIRATRIPQTPKTLIAEILCDADLYHLGTAAFSQINQLVQQEMKLRGWHIENWELKTLAFLQTHQYHTAYCRKKLDVCKRWNIDFMQHG